MASNKANNKLMFDLHKQLSNANRELQLTQQINHQLEKIRQTLINIKDIKDKLLYDIADLDDNELEELHQTEREAKSELESLEKRYKMLKSIQANGCVLAVKQIAIRSAANTKYYNDVTDDEESIADEDRHNDKPVRANKSSINGRVDYREDTEEPSDDETGDRKSARKTFSPNRFKASPTKSSKRKVTVPERFDAEVKPKSYYSQSKRANGMQNDE